MIPASNAFRHKFTIIQLVAAGLLTLFIGGCGHKVVCPPSNPPKRSLGTDTPLVIVGGSIHLKERYDDWKACDGSSSTGGSSPTCYKAKYPKDKNQLKNYQLVDEDFNVTETSISDPEWEIDVEDLNPDNQPGNAMKHGVLVCSESSLPFTSCDHTGKSSKLIYVIAIGGTFDPPSGPNGKQDRLVYRDKATDGTNTDYAFISDIRLNAKGGSGGDSQPCKDNSCTLVLSSQ